MPDHPLTPEHPEDLTPPTLASPPAADIFDATTPPGVEQLPAVTTSMTPAQFKAWLNADGALFVVYLPDNRSFIIKVPQAHHEFFVAMMQQVRFALGGNVQAVRMNVVSGEPPAAEGTATEAPGWAQPPGGAEHTVHEPAPPTEHVMRDADTCGMGDGEAPCPHGVRRSRYCSDCDVPGGRYDRARNVMNTPLPRGDGPAFA